MLLELLKLARSWDCLRLVALVEIVDLEDQMRKLTEHSAPEIDELELALITAAAEEH